MKEDGRESELLNTIKTAKKSLKQSFTLDPQWANSDHCTFLNWLRALQRSNHNEWRITLVRRILCNSKPIAFAWIHSFNFGFIICVGTRTISQASTFPISTCTRAPFKLTCEKCATKIHLPSYLHDSMGLVCRVLKHLSYILALIFSSSNFYEWKIVKHASVLIMVTVSPHRNREGCSICPIFSWKVNRNLWALHTAQNIYMWRILPLSKHRFIFTMLDWAKILGGTFSFNYYILSTFETHTASIKRKLVKDFD